MSIEELGASKKTFMLDKRLEKKLRYIQAQLIANDDKNWSLSKIINLMLLYALTDAGKNTSPDPSLLKSFLDGKKLDLDNTLIDEIIKMLFEEN